MALNMRSPSSSDAQAPAHTYPVARSLAILVLIAVVLLAALRHVFGSVHVEGGVR